MKKNLLLLFTTLIFLGILLEVLFRLTGQYVSYGERSSTGGYNTPFKNRNEFGYGWDETPPPHTEQRINKLEFNYTWISNNEGLRGKDIELQKHGKRILVFGDSFTEGMGVADDSTYPHLLGNLANKYLDSAAEVINCGPSASDIFTEYKLFTGKMLKYKPDIVLVTFNSTDLYEYTIRGGFERFKPGNKVEYRKPPWFEPFYAKSYLVRFIVHDVFQYDYSFLRPHEHDAIAAQAINKTCAAIDSFNLLCQANNSRFGMVFHPMGCEYPVDEYQNAPVIAYCKKANIPFVDELEFLTARGINENNIKKYYWQKDGHFNNKGYELLARCVYEFFQNQGWLNEKNNYAKTDAL